MPAVDKEELGQRISVLGERAAEGTGIEVVEVQLRGAGKARLLRVYIDKPGGVTHGDCELISSRFGQILDEADAIPGAEGYTLEVSSPGAERKLTKPRDFERVIGQKIRVTLREAVEGSLQYEGTLQGVANETLALLLPSGPVLQLPLNQVQKANLKFEW